MRRSDDLRSTLRRIDGRGYKAYKEIAGRYRVGEMTLTVDHVQGDPFAAPSRLRLALPAEVAGYPDWALAGPARRTALADFLTRSFAAATRRLSGGRMGSGKSGLVAIEAPRQEVLERTSVLLDGGAVEARFVAGLPARGRKVMGLKATELLLEEIPRAALESLPFEAVDGEALARHVEAVEDQRALRRMLAERGWIAFVADGSVLPRRSGVDPRPLEGRVVPFESPPELAAEVELPNRGTVCGMAVPEGVTLVVGGGYHGKSTLLAALELGVYDHLPGDGRELVVSRPDAVKIRAEDGRRIARVDISPFIANLPFGDDTTAFESDNASGSTSQAANIVEALEAGAGVLLIDEDTSATNFMIRDHRMQQLVAKAKEPITPFIDKVRQLYRERGVSSVIVVGGAGDYFDVADTVILMDGYRPREVTGRARQIAERFRELRTAEGGESFGAITPRCPDPASLDPSRGKRRVKVDVRGVDAIRFGTWEIDLAAVSQLVETAQTRAVAESLLALKQHHLEGASLPEALDRLETALEGEGLDHLGRGNEGGFARPRRFEVAAALNRLRSLRVE